MTVVNLRELAEDNAQVLPLTVKQYHKMIKAGLIEDGAPYELLDGVLVRKQRHATGEDPMTVGDKHAWVIKQFVRLAHKFERHGCHITVQLPITIPQYDEPEPDGAIIRGAIEDDRCRHPGPKDVLCVIEVADASIRRDRTIKQRIYADAGIPLYLIFDLPARSVEVRSQPVKGKGQYADTTILSRKEKLVLPAGTTKKLVVPVKQLMPD
jgi:Uma2 family endonuclease